MTDVIAPDAIAPVDDAELAAAREAAATTATASAPTPEGMIRLYHPTYEGLEFGDRHAHGNTIHFGPKGGFEPHVWIGPADHPLLASMLERYPEIISIDAPSKVYVCDVCSREFNVAIALRSHRKTHAKDG